MKNILRPTLRKKLTVAILTLGLVIIATPGLTGQQGLNILFAVQGNVSIQREGSNSYQRVYIGALVNTSDRLRLDKKASVKVLCDNLQIWNIGSQGEIPVSQGCTSTGKTALIRPGSRLAPTRAGNNPTIPYLISPRDSGILARQPMLRWNPVAKATSYQVQVLGPGINWQTQVKQPQVVYGGESLKPGSRYWVTVTANNGASNQQEEGRFRGFSVLSDANRQRVNTEIAQLKQLSLENEVKALTLAHLYRGNNLNADAIDLLEELVKKGSQSATVFHLLGSIYQDVGLNQLARERYLTGLKLATAQKNLEVQAMMQASLGEVDVALDKLQDAVLWYQAALVNYRQLGDTAKVGELQQKLNELKRRV
jgi:hypothetical protein